MPSAEGEEPCYPTNKRRKIVFSQNNKCSLSSLGQSKLQHPAISKTSFTSALTCLSHTRTGKDPGRQRLTTERLYYVKASYSTGGILNCLHAFKKRSKTHKMDTYYGEICSHTTTALLNSCRLPNY